MKEFERGSRTVIGRSLILVLVLEAGKNCRNTIRMTEHEDMGERVGIVGRGPREGSTVAFRVVGGDHYSR